VPRRDGIQLFLGDCRALLEEIDLDQIDAVVTDPPYGLNGGRAHCATDRQKNTYATELWQDTEDYIRSVCVPVIEALIRRVPRLALTPGRWLMHLYPRPADVGCFWTPAAVTRGPWGFSTFQPIFYYGRDWRAGIGQLPSGRQVTERAEKNGHPCSKPLGPWRWLVEKAARPGGVVLDPFMGSGTSGVACIQSGHGFVGIEIDPAYFAIAQCRIREALLTEREKTCPNATV
jgi:DNA modification methylase